MVQHHSRAATAAALQRLLTQAVHASGCAVSVAILDDPCSPGGKAAFLKEPWIAPREKGASAWRKWTRNDGHIFPGEGTGGGAGREGGNGWTGGAPRLVAGGVGDLETVAG